MQKNSRSLISTLIFLIVSLSFSAHAQIQISDDTGQVITLQQPAHRVISLSPGLTELLYAAGGQDYIKGVVNFSDYPEHAKTLPQVGSSNALDMEKILTLQAELIVAWSSGNPHHQIAKLKKLGLSVYISEPDQFSDIAETMIKLGTLMGTETIARQSAQDFTQQLSRLKKHYKITPNRVPKKTFIQIWNKPIMSVNENHLISKVISLCGGENIFGKEQSLTLSPNIEAILVQNPEVIIATGMADTSAQWLKSWQQWSFLSAVKNKQLYAVNPDHLVRHTPRILLGIKEVCELLN